MEKIYLSDSISDADSFSITELNLIVAPAGSGKTYFALTKLPDLLKIEHKERILYLIDTCAGRDQICYLNKDNAVFYDTLWLKERESDDNNFEGFQTEPEKIVVMTYAFFGKLVLHFFNLSTLLFAMNSIIRSGLSLLKNSKMKKHSNAR